MRSIKKLTGNILETAEGDQLRAAIKKYASKNKDFNHYLLLKFLHLIPSDQPTEKYSGFFSSYLRKYLDRPDKLSPRSCKQLTESFEELRQQSFDLISTKNYIEAYGIIQNLILYVSLLIEKMLPSSDEQLVAMEGKIQDALDKLGAVKVPRPLAAEIEKNLFEQLINGAVRTVNPDKNSLDFLLRQKESMAGRKVIIEQLIQFNNRQNPKSVTTSLLSKALLHQLVKYKFKKPLDDFLKSNKLGAAEVIDRVEQYYQMERADYAQHLITRSISAYPKNVLPLFLEKKLTVELNGNEYERAHNTLLELIQSSHSNSKLIEKIFRNIPDDFKEVVKEELSDESLESTVDIPNKEVKAHTLIWLEREEEFMDWAIKGGGEIKLLLRFNKQLYRSRPKNLKRAYTRYFDHYLKYHIGNQSAIHVSELLSEIRRSGALKLAEELEAYVQKVYGYRKSIVNLEKH